MADLLRDPAQLSAVLSMLNANDSKTIKKGEKLLKPFTKTEQCIVPLLNQLQMVQDVSIRHHAALLLKKQLGAHYKKYNATQQVQLRAQVLAIMGNEPVAVVATSIAGAVAVVAKHTLKKGESWPELFQALVSLSQSPVESMRVLNFRLLEQMAEHLANELKPHTAVLAQMFQAGCQDAVPAVSTAAFKAASEFINEIGNEPEVLQLQGIVLPMLAVLGKCLANGDEDVVRESMEFIQNCCALEQPLIDQHIAPIVQFCMQTLQNASYDPPVRNAAFETLLAAVECRPKLLAKQNLVNPILSALMEMIAKVESGSAAGSLFSFTEAIQEGTDGDDDDEKVDVQKLAQTMIDRMALSIPSKYFADPALALCAQGMASPDPHVRKAGCAVLGVMAEGCCDRIRETLDMILPALLNSVADPEFYVREVACFALGQFSEFCTPEIQSFHSTVLPVLVNALDDPKPTVKATSCYVIEFFCESLQPVTLRPVLPLMLQKLAAILQTGDRHCQQTALSAISSAAVAAEKEFLPYVNGLTTMLHPLLFTEASETFTTRGRALECLGHIAVAVGPDEFRPYFPVGMQAAQQGITLGDEALSEYSYVFFANAAKVMKLDMLPYLATLVPHLHTVIEQSEMMKTLKEGDDDDDDDEYVPPTGAKGAAAGGDDDDDDSEGNSDYDFNVHEGFINTKKAALTALGALAEHCLAHFHPFLEASMASCTDIDNGACTSIHEDIRSEGYSIMQYFLSVSCHANGITEAPAQGVTIPLNDNVLKIARQVIEAYIFAIQDDVDKTVVGSCLEGMAAVLRTIGVAALQIPVFDKNEPALQHLMTAVLEVLKEKSACQMRVEAVHDEDDDDHDNVVMDSVTDLVGQLAKSMGPTFLPYFDEFQKHLMKFTKPNRLHSDRSMAIGCFGEVVAELGPQAIKYAEILLPMVKTCLTDSMEGVRRNAAYCVGTLVSSTGKALVPQFMTILSWLHPLCIRPESKKGQDVGGADIDNALASVVRLIMASPADVPMQHVLPVLLGGLPLVSDNSEGPGIYQCLSFMLASKEPTCVAAFNSILPIFAECFAPEATATDETKTIVRTALKQLFQEEPFRAAITAYVPTIAIAEQKTQIEQILSN